MQKQFIDIMKCLLIFISLAVILSCEKEHLQPDFPGDAEPLVYIIARLDNDSVGFAGGLHSYIGSVAVCDTLSNRVFSFTLKDPQNPFHSYFQISINNYRSVLGVLQNDLDSSIYADTRHYQEAGHFSPLAATVEWIDSAGVRFSSASMMQSSAFTINHVEDILFEEKTYKKSTVEFSCTLSDINGHVLHLTHGRATILLGIE